MDGVFRAWWTSAPMLRVHKRPGHQPKSQAQSSACRQTVSSSVQHVNGTKQTKRLIHAFQDGFFSLTDLSMFNVGGKKRKKKERKKKERRRKKEKERKKQERISCYLWLWNPFIKLSVSLGFLQWHKLSTAFFWNDGKQHTTVWHCLSPLKLSLAYNIPIPDNTL